jgi:hypothetical protein
MSYEKQTWNKYDDLKTEEENIENGAVVTDNRMNHMETGIGDNDTNLASHLANTANPHKVTAAQVGLGNIKNFGLATEDEAKQGDSNAKYMTPSLTQAVLSANINSTAYANSADGTYGFTTVYPNLNLLNFQSGLKIGQFLAWADGLTIGPNPARAVFDYVSVIPGTTYTINSNWDKTERIAIYAYDSNDRKNATFIYDGSSAKWLSPSAIGRVITQKTTLSIPDGMNFIRVVFFAKDTSATLTLQDMLDAKTKVEQGSTATPYMPSSSEVTTADWPKFVGFSNTVKTNKSASDYTWFPVKDSELTNKVESHVNNKANPHSVTASQVGAYSKTEADVKFATGQSLIDLSTTVEGKADDSAVVHKTGDETIGGKKTFTEEIKQKNDVDWTYIPDSSNRAEYMRRGGTVTIRWDFTSTGNFDISLGSLPTDFAPRKRIFKSIPEASTTNSMHTLQINAFTGGSPGAITLFKATTGAVFSGQESFVVI